MLFGASDVMRLLFLLPILFLCAGWTHGSASLPQPDVTCNLVTGVATGVGAGTCINTPAVCNGDLTNIGATVSITTSTNALSATTAVFSAGMVGKGIIVPGAGSNGGDLNTTVASFIDSQHVTTVVSAGTTLSSAAVTVSVGTSIYQAMLAFQTWAISTWQASHAGTVGLFIPSGSQCQMNVTSSGAIFAGIRKLIVSGYGASLVVFGPDPMFFGGSGLNNQNGVASHCALINTVSSGATQVTAVTAAEAALMTSGQYALVLGYDMQGAFDSDFGYPPNPGYFDFVLVSGVNAGTGVVQFSTTALSADYKSTWPKIGPDPGPATICPMPDNWNLDFDFRGFSFTQCCGDIGSASNGYRVTFRDMAFTGANGPTGSQNHEINLLNVSCPACTIEADKIVDVMNLQGGTYSVLLYQSSSIKQVIANGVTANQLKGGGKNFVGNNVSFPTKVFTSVSGYGNTNSFTCTNCVLGTAADPDSLDTSSTSEAGLGNRGITNVYQMSSGTIKVANGRRISAVSSGTAGVIRLTLVCAAITPGCTTPTAPYFENQWVRVSNSSNSGANGERQIHIVDANNIELLGTTFSGSTAAGGSMWTDNPGRWSVPNSYLLWGAGVNGGTSNTFKITDVTQDGDFIYIATNWSGGFPTIGGTVVGSFIVYPVPQWTCTTCTGHVRISDMNQGTPGIPIFSYSKRRYFGSDMTEHSPDTRGIQYVIGSMTTSTFNVVTPFTLSGGLTATPTDRNVIYNSDLTAFRWAPIVNLKNAGGSPHTIVVSPAGVTGSQTGDDQLCDSSPSPACTVKWASGEWFQGAGFNGFNPSVLVGNTVCPTQGTTGCPVIDVEYKGNVNIPYLLRRDIDRSLPANDNRPLNVDIAA